VCVTLVIAASLEVEHGIENLWATTSDGFKDPPDYGKFIPVHYFRAFVCAFPHLWSPEELWYSNNMPWDSFKPFVEAFNQKRRDLVRTVYLLMDESMSAWRPKTSATGGLPNITFEPRKPKPLGTMFKNGVEATTGIMVTQDVVEGSTAQSDKKYVGGVSSLPKKEPIMAHVAETLRQCESANLASGGWVGGDAWFGSIPCVVELKNRLNVYSTFIIKQNVQYCPLDVIKRILQSRNKKGNRSGRHVVMKANISGVDLFLLAYAWSNKRAAYIVSSCGTTVMHEIPYRSHFTDDYGNVTFKEIPRPSIAHFYFELCPLVDNHNKDRQGILGLEDCWPTKNPWFRLVTTLIGMSVVDLHRWDRNKRSGGKPFDWLKADEDRPEFLKVRSMANLIARGLRKHDMKYYTEENPRASVPMIRSRWGTSRHPHLLVRITDENGNMRRPDGGKEYQKSCFICRQYRKEPVNTVWCCSSCSMPLCKKSRRRERTCHEEHKYYHEDQQLGCCQGRDTFVLPKEYRLYEQASGARDLPPLPIVPAIASAAIASANNDAMNVALNDALFASTDEHGGEYYSAASSESESESLDSTDEALCRASEERERRENAKKRGKAQSKAPARRRKQPKRVCKGMGGRVKAVV
jgi:hypothetical protein